jgi:hypothetical protein
MFLAALIALAVVAAIVVVALCSAHIPGLRDLTGAAPLQPEDPGPCIRAGGCCHPVGVCLHGCRDAADQHTRLSQEIDAGEVAS